jgi:hypothetical protein
LGHTCGSGGGGGGGGYCAATATHACATGDEYVANVTLNTLNNTSPCGQYSNFTSQTTTLARGQQYTASVNTAIVGSPNVAYLDNQIAVWIDFNNNQTFETSERVGLTTVAQNTAFPVQYSFTVPVGASLGNVRISGAIDYLNVSSGMMVTTPATFTNNVFIGGDLTVSGNIILDAIGFDDLQVSGSATIANTLSVTGNTTLINANVTQNLIANNFNGNANTKIFTAIESAEASALAFSIALG